MFACFLSLLQIDLQFMSELSGMVPVVPVLAKADTMTSEELKVSHCCCAATCFEAWGCAALCCGLLCRSSTPAQPRPSLPCPHRSLLCPPQEFRHRVREAVQPAGTAWRFSQEALDEAGARHGPPFAVIGSNMMDLEVGR